MFGIVASIAGPVIGGLFQKDSADKASGIQQQADAEAIKVQRESLDEVKRQYDQNRSDLAPYRETGNLALGKLNAGLTGGVEGAARKILSIFPSWSATGIPGQPGTAQEIVDSFIKSAPQIIAQGGDKFGYEGYGQATYDLLKELQPGMEAAQNVPDLLRKFTAKDLVADPVYQSGLQFGLDRGTRAIEQNAARTGMRNSGNTLKALTQFGNDYGSTKANESYNRFMNDKTSVFNMLSGAAGTGQNATNATVGAGNTATGAVTGINNNIAGIMSSGGNARGAAAIAGGNALGGAGNTIANWWNQKNFLDRILPQTNASTIPSTFGYDSSGGPAYG